MRRVVVTGIGLLTALGTGRQDTWDGLLAGRSSIKPIEAYDPSSFTTRQAALIEDFDPTGYAARRALRMTTRNDQLAIAGAALAVQDAGIDFAGYDPHRSGVFLGGNKEISNPQHMLEGCLAARGPDGKADLQLLGERATSAFYPLYYVEGLQSASLFYVSQAYGFKGANAYFHGTADSGLTAIGRGFRSIRRGESDVVIAGGFDDASSWWTMTKFDGLGVLSDRNDRGAEAFRPYDRERSGSIFGEGAAFFILEEREQALARGAHAYAEVTGFGSTLDRLITPEPSGEALAAALAKAMEEARTDRVDYVAAHGCATRLGDASEAAAFRKALPGPVCASSVKPVAGHLVAGAGALNAAVCALAVDTGAVPPTAHLDDLDPDCAFDWVPNTARELPVETALAVGRGLEGQQVALALGRA